MLKMQVSIRRQLEESLGKIKESNGYSEFLCRDDVVPEDDLGQADEKLYKDKQKKRKNSMK